jgi:hypothetical protein
LANSYKNSRWSIVIYFDHFYSEMYKWLGSKQIAKMAICLGAALE